MKKSKTVGIVNNLNNERVATLVSNSGKPNKILDIETARQCMNFKLLRCDNKECLNESCPLNKVYDKNKNTKNM